MRQTPTIDPRSSVSLRRQRGASKVALLLAVLLGAGVASGGWWWAQRAALADSAGKPGGNAAAIAGATGAADTASAAASAAASGAGSGGPGAGPGGPGGAGNRRFGGANRVQPVTVAVARKQDVKVVLAAIGNISALNTATVRTRVEGELKVIRFKEGQLVRAGAVLAEIDPRSFEIALAQVQGQLAKDQSLLKNAQLDLARYKDLLAKDSIAKQQVDTQEALVGQLTAAVQTDQALVDNAKLQLSYTKITAPISGRLGLKLADLGNTVRASDAAGIVTITQTQPISVVFAVPEANLAQIARKLKGTDPLTVEAWDREQRTMLASGKVNTTDNAIDAITGTIKVKAEFANAEGTLFPNQFVNIKLQVNTLEGALAVPSTAIQRGALGTFVYVVKADSTVNIRRVRVGTTEGDWVSVQGDMTPGERVVTDGADRLREGAKVEVITPAARPGGFGPGGFGPGGPGGSGGRPGGGGARPDVGATASPTGPASSAPSSGEANAGPGARSRPINAGPGAPDGPPRDAPPPEGSTRGGPPRGAPPSGAAPAAAAGKSAAGDSSWIENLPPEAQERVRNLISRLPPDEVTKLNKMSPDERRAYFQQLRERRQQQQQNQ